jgi:hypothetical protein
MYVYVRCNLSAAQALILRQIYTTDKEAGGCYIFFLHCFALFACLFAGDLDFLISRSLLFFKLLARLSGLFTCFIFYFMLAYLLTLFTYNFLQVQFSTLSSSPLSSLSSLLCFPTSSREPQGPKWPLLVLFR